ncbi:MAG TPA: methyltransferase regulatory domain-containing protein [Caulobacteraceae bacterium]|jgi:SAM-dependent methyltransferase
MTTIYDEIVYPNPPFPFTQPNRLAVAAALFGRDYAPPEACRVLEIGCGDGGNLIPMAAAFPGSEFYGFDLAASVIDSGRAMIAATGLTNIQLDALDLMDPGDIGQFDYVIAHGLYAWVPAPVQDGLMALISRVLSPRGVAHVSYNTLPGCRIRQAVRDMTLAWLEGIDEPARRLTEALAFLKVLAESYDEEVPAERAVARHARRMLEQRPEVTFHDELGPEYNPVLVRDFIAHAGAHGLQFLCEAEPPRIEPKVPKSESARAVMSRAGGDVALAEQYSDILNLESFRQSLLCRADPPVERRLDPSRLRALHLAADLKPDPEGGFQGPLGARIRTPDPRGTALFERLAAAWPSTVPLSEVDEDIYPQLLDLHLNGVAELYAAPRPVTPPGPRPRLWPVARAELQAGRRQLTARTHHQVALTDAEGLFFVSLLDGERTREQIARDMAARIGAPAEAVAAGLEEHLARLGRAGVLDA